MQANGPGSCRIVQARPKRKTAPLIQQPVSTTGLDLGIIEIAPPSFGEQEIKHIAEDVFGLSGRVKSLVSERDQNARLITDGDEYVFKIANSAEGRSFLEFQNAALEHVSLVDPGLMTPKLINNNRGAGITAVERQGEVFNIRVLTFLPGEIFAGADKSLALYKDLGRFMGRVTRAFSGFIHPAALRPNFSWNLDNVLASRAFIADIDNSENRELVDYFFERYEQQLVPLLRGLRCAVIHNDANDHNLLIDPKQRSRICGLIDFGDIVFARQVNELATTMAYALMDVPDLMQTAQALIEGYTSAFSLTEEELAVLFDLVAMRLAMSVCNSSHNAREYPDNDYLTVSQQPALRLLARLKAMDKSLLLALARTAAAYPVSADDDATTAWIQANASPMDKLSSVDLYCSPRIPVPPQTAQRNGTDFSRQVKRLLKQNTATFAVTSYGEKVHSSDEDKRLLAVEFYFDEPTDIFATRDGRVVSIVEDKEQVYSVLIEYQAGDCDRHYYLLYRHIQQPNLSAGQTVGRGDVIGTVCVDGEDVAQLTIQLLLTKIVDVRQVPTFCPDAGWRFWSAVCIDPNVLLKLPQETFFIDPKPPQVLIAQRDKLLGPSYSLSYNKKLKIVRGDGAYLIDHSGRAFLDCVNNITHVGHCNPHVVGALSRQAAILNTNTRYLSEQINTLAERILRTMPDPLSVVYLVNSGSEANELAMRLAQATSGRKNMIVLDWAYHGNTGGLVDLSPYKFNRKGGKGRPDHVSIAEFPDPYRGRVTGYAEETGKQYADSVKDAVDDLVERTGEGPAAFIAESIAGVGGQVIYPRGYLRYAYQHVRAAGALCIADEVQTGFGRVGTHGWAFEQQGVVPDIVTMGKPMGNGHPIAAVVTNREIADAFANGMEYFNSFGGNPVSCAVGNAVLDVIEQRGLQEQAVQTGAYLMQGLTEMSQRHELIGDVRGSGLFVGAELVEDRETLVPATAQANAIVQHLRENAVLLSTDGPRENVLKLKPPMVFGRAEADFLLDKLDKAFTAIVQE